MNETITTNIRISLPEAELFVVDREAGLELVVGGVAAFSQVLAQDACQVGQVLDPHRPVRLNRHLVEDEVVPILHGAHHRLLNLPLDVVINLRLQTDPDPVTVCLSDCWQQRIQKAVSARHFPHL